MNACPEKQQLTAEQKRQVVADMIDAYFHHTTPQLKGTQS